MGHLPVRAQFAEKSQAACLFGPPPDPLLTLEGLMITAIQQAWHPRWNRQGVFDFPVRAQIVEVSRPVCLFGVAGSFLSRAA